MHLITWHWSYKAVDSETKIYQGNKQPLSLYASYIPSRSSKATHIKGSKYQMQRYYRIRPSLYLLQPYTVTCSLKRQYQQVGKTQPRWLSRIATAFEVGEVKGTDCSQNMIGRCSTGNHSNSGEISRVRKSNTISVVPLPVNMLSIPVEQ